MQKSDRVNLESPWQPKTSKRMNRRLTLLQPEETLAIIPNAPANCLKHSVPIQIATVPSIHITFTNSDLPTGTQNRFRDILAPMFRDYVGTWLTLGRLPLAMPMYTSCKQSGILYSLTCRTQLLSTMMQSSIW